MSLQQFTQNITSIFNIRTEPRLVKCGRMTVYNVGIINILHYNSEFCYRSHRCLFFQGAFINVVSPITDP